MFFIIAYYLREWRYLVVIRWRRVNNNSPRVAREMVTKRLAVRSFSKLVFPHIIARIITVEQRYRASQIAVGGKYHHE
jgi:23S rRNA pseudoU1915 N3-methylase RlmH